MGTPLIRCIIFFFIKYQFGFVSRVLLATFAALATQLLLGLADQPLVLVQLLLLLLRQLQASRRLLLQLLVVRRHNLVGRSYC